MNLRNAFYAVATLALLPRALRVVAAATAMLLVVAIGVPVAMAIGAQQVPNDSAVAVKAARVATGSEPADPLACFSSDVKALCCPGACAARKGPQWPRSNAILRACMSSIGCSPGETGNATVGMRCDCK